MTLRIDDDGNVEKLLELLPVVIKKVQQLELDKRLVAEYYDLEACFNLRGGGHFSTFRNKRYYQPKGGVPDTQIQGRNVWTRATVEEWLKQTDFTLEAYNEKYRTGAKK